MEMIESYEEKSIFKNVGNLFNDSKKRINNKRILTKDEINVLKDISLTNKQVGELLNCSSTTARIYRLENGISRKKWDKKSLQKLEKLLLNGFTIDEIAEIFKCDKKRIFNKITSEHLMERTLLINKDECIYFIKKVRKSKNLKDVKNKTKLTKHQIEVSLALCIDEKVITNTERKLINIKLGLKTYKY